MVDREQLEKRAVAEVYACKYYDLADTLNETLDEDLQVIATHAYSCDVCGR